MTDSELLDMFAQERINMHLQEVKKKEKLEERKAIISEMENFINNLTDKERVLVENYIQDYENIMENHETILYKCGLIDGMKVIKKIQEL